jgi:transposase
MSRRPSKFVKPLSEADSKYLNQVWRAHKTYTVRCRAHAILLSNQGYSVSELQEIFGISKPTALGWINRWQEHGREGLEDEPRPGGPPHLTEQQQKEVVKPLLEQFPREPKKVIDAIDQKTGQRISRSTLRRIARKLGLRWKRFRRSQRKQRDERQFRLALEEIEQLRSLPDTQLAYFDEAGFSTQAIVPYGWQPIGTRGEVPVGRERKSIQVLGIQEEAGDVYGYLHQGIVYGTTVAQVLDDYSQHISTDTILILDNASVHTCNLVFDRMDGWNERGLYLYFLPPHSPELNAIERLWKKLKYQKLPIACWDRVSSLAEHLTHIFRDMGEATLMPSLQSQ